MSARSAGIPRRSGDPDREKPVVKAGLPDFVLIVILGILVLYGLSMVYSATSVDVHDTGDPYGMVKRQALSLLLGTGVAVFVAAVPYRVLRGRVLPYMVAGSFAMLVLLMFPNPLRGAPGPGGIAYRWLFNGALRFQPSELSKFAMIAFAANFLERRIDAMQGRHWMKHWAVYWGIIGLTAVMIVRQPDLGTAMVLGGVAVFMTISAGMNWKAIIAIAVSGVGAVFLFSVTSAYRWKRISAWLDPWPEAQRDAYQAIQGFVALAKGGLFGVGLGQSTQKLGYLPEHHTDYILAILSEELGLVGGLFLLLLYGLFAWRGLRIARYAPDRFSSLLASGLTTLVVFQGFLNVAVISGLFPVTGVPLPFISYGGTSLIVNLATFGVLIGISRYRLDPDELDDVE